MESPVQTCITQGPGRATIAHAIGQAADGDVVLLAGKGHEDYQEIRGERRPFLDEAEARAALARRREARGC